MDAREEWMHFPTLQKGPHWGICGICGTPVRTEEGNGRLLGPRPLTVGLFLFFVALFCCLVVVHWLRRPVVVSQLKRSSLLTCMNEKKVVGKLEGQLMWADMNTEQRNAVLRVQVCHNQRAADVGRQTSAPSRPSPSFG